jgi:uncharacterized phiE125 gp8 family phage protein
MYSPVLVDAPFDTPVSLDEVKAQLDLGYEAKDAYITTLLAAAVNYLDGYSGVLGRCMVSQSWRQDFDDFSSCLNLPQVPVSEITSVTYIDTDGATQVVDPSDYQLVSKVAEAYVIFDSDYTLPALNVDGPSVSVTYVAGFGDAEAVPAVMKQIIFLLVRHWFDNPSAVVVGVPAQAMPFAIDALIGQARKL